MTSGDVEALLKGTAFGPNNFAKYCSGKTNNKITLEVTRIPKPSSLSSLLSHPFFLQERG